MNITAIISTFPYEEEWFMENDHSRTAVEDPEGSKTGVAQSHFAAKLNDFPHPVKGACPNPRFGWCYAREFNTMTVSEM